MAEKTVKNYVSHVLAKLGMSSRTQVAVLSTEIRDHKQADTDGIAEVRRRCTLG